MTNALKALGYVITLALITITAQAADRSEQPNPAPTTSNHLDLRAPELTRIFSLAQINAILSRAVDPALEHVEVEALRLGDLPFEDNSASDGEVVFQSIARWLAPSQAYAANVNVTPDATDPYRPAPMVQTNYHASFSPPASQR